MAEVVSVQNRLSPAHLEDRAVLTYCGQHGIAYLAYSPLGGSAQAGKIETTFPAFAHVAARRSLSPQRIVLAWELALSPVLMPVAGSSRPETAVDIAGASSLVLEPEELAVLEACIGA